MTSSTRRTADVLSDAPSFKDLLLPPHIIRSITNAGYLRPSPVQHAAIPITRIGKDAIIQAKAGTGKTLVFAITAVEHVDASNPMPQALILAPTREIALQAADVIVDVTGSLPLTTVTLIGGLPTAEDDRVLRRKSHIIVGTPGRVLSLIQRGSLITKSISLLVLDEADKLLSDDLRDDVRAVLDRLPTLHKDKKIGPPMHSNVNNKEKRKKTHVNDMQHYDTTHLSSMQFLAVSATYDDKTLDELRFLMRMPHEIMLCSDTVSLLGVSHYYLTTSSTRDASTSATTKYAALIHILSRVPFNQAVVFVNSKMQAELIANQLSDMQGQSVACLSAGKDQLERIQILNSLRRFRLRVVVSTDVAARGVDLEGVNLVVNYEMPAEPATLMHRVGRAGRFGTRGIAITFVENKKDQDTLHEALQEISGGEIHPLLYPVPLDWNPYYNAIVSPSAPIQNENIPHFKPFSIPSTPATTEIQKKLAHVTASQSHRDILTISLWDNEAGLHPSHCDDHQAPLPSPQCWPLQLSDLGSSRVSPESVALRDEGKGDSHDVVHVSDDASASRPVESNEEAPHGDQDIDLEYTVEEKERAINHYAMVIASVMTDVQQRMQREGDGVVSDASDSVRLLHEAFDTSSSSNNSIGHIRRKEGIEKKEGIIVDDSGKSGKQKRMLGSTQATAFSKQRMELEKAALAEEAALFESICFDTNVAMNSHEEDDENERVWREYWMQHYYFYGYYPGGGPGAAAQQEVGCAPVTASDPLTLDIQPGYNTSTTLSRDNSIEQQQIADAQQAWWLPREYPKP